MKTFLVALISFKRAGVSRAIIETGLGGRLDATRCVKADFCAITTISEDHLDILGPTLVDVASGNPSLGRPNHDVRPRQPGDRVTSTSIDRSGFPLAYGQFNRQTLEKMVQYGFRDWNAPGVGKGPANIRWPGRDGTVHISRNVTVRLSAAHNLEGIGDEASRLDGDAVMCVGFTQKDDLERMLGTFDE